MSTDGCARCGEPRLGDLLVCYDCARLCRFCGQPSNDGVCPACKRAGASVEVEVRGDVIHESVRPPAPNQVIEATILFGEADDGSVDEWADNYRRPGSQSVSVKEVN